MTDIRTIDSHEHIMNGKEAMLLELADKYGYEKQCVVSIPMQEGLAANNFECLLAKSLAPARVYAYGGMMYSPRVTPTAEEHEAQLAQIMAMGFDGWKILESKAVVQKGLGLPLDSPVFDKAFALAEETGFPITWHAGDPATFWDETKAPSFAAEHGWLCTAPGFPKLTEIYTQVENVFARHPKLRVTMAHLFFTSDDRAHAERLLDTYENLCLDVTPGVEMYWAFRDDPEGWRAFFTRYSDRLIYGTDMYDDEGDFVMGSLDGMTDYIRKTLLGSVAFTVPPYAGQGLALPRRVQEKLMAENFERVAGKTPKPIAAEKLDEYLAFSAPYLTEREQAYARGKIDAIRANLAR